jgi:hypothetical protein
MYKHSGVICIDAKKKRKKLLQYERYINANVTDIVSQ